MPAETASGSDHAALLIRRESRETRSAGEFYASTKLRFGKADGGVMSGSTAQLFVFAPLKLNRGSDRIQATDEDSGRISHLI
jgi:hypothetical protein